MRYKNILITGGAGFVGSNLALSFAKKYPDTRIVTFDNLKRRGSELNIPRLTKAGVQFVHGDVRKKEDFEQVGSVDLILECSAEPSVLAGRNESPAYLLETNLVGTIHCLEVARQQKADIVFLSTSRVYPIEEIGKLSYKETGTRFELEADQKISGASEHGISEEFPLGKTRSLYGATKLASEFIIQEYLKTYDLRGIINRCGVITGPWQMGKVDQGVIVLWVARHIFKKPLSYIGYGGAGKQVRDFIHIDDLFELIDMQISDIGTHSGEVYNVGGGKENSISLAELTTLCQKITGNTVAINSILENRPDDLPIYISDCKKIQKVTGWTPRKNAETTVREITEWILENKESLAQILG
jgi:CDP-paratose 2-epimerase